MVNDDYEDGLASSIACGVRSVAESADAILLMFADLPRKQLAAWTVVGNVLLNLDEVIAKR